MGFGGLEVWGFVMWIKLGLLNALVAWISMGVCAVGLGLG